MITGCLQKKNGYYYAVLYLKVDGKRKTKWIATKLPVSTTSERKAQKALDEIRMQYELQQESKQETAAILAGGCSPEAQILFVDYMEKWLNNVRPSIATATYQSYSVMESQGHSLLHSFCRSTWGTYPATHRGFLPDHPQ